MMVPWLVLLGLVLSGQADAKPAAAALETRVVLPDLELLDQSGRRGRLLGDFIGDRIAVVDFVYGSCTTVCPLLSGVMARLQRDLGQDLGEKVVLLSLSVTPGRDTPVQLARAAAAFKPRPGWFWLTGDPARMQPVLQAFGAAVVDPERHAPMILVGRGNDSRWLRRLGLPSPMEMRSMIARFAR